ncbi:MAG TPA: LuxR C-terminal-related transcriptional regulator, partial [Candidatus Binatus sp.]|nr:LuxR C-terminal-related transcriptional regulator [Candidatus Binatus sp.]
RPALFERLSAQGSDGVTLVAAPAGSGKTVLLRSWIAAENLGPHTAWLTVERGESDPQHFWLAFVGALRSVAGGEAVVERPTAAPEFDGDAFVERLIEELERLPEALVLVIDDLHELASPEAEQQLALLIARHPRRLRVIVASRHDPQLGLHRLRLSGDLLELRAADLRFTPGEASQLLAASGVTLSDQATARLHAKTEGWAAGLRLAALSLSGRSDPEAFVDDFAGTDRMIADYLLAEVLDREPTDVRRLLLETSVLDQVSGPLADRVVGTSGSERVLLELDASNAFVTAIDRSRTWFRYHQLFGDLLRLELRRTNPERVPALHRAAAGWYTEQGEIVEALRHLQVAGDWEAAGRLLADHKVSLVLDGHGAAVDALLAAFPADVLDDPELLALLAYRELTERSLGGAAEKLGLAERRTALAPADRQRDAEVALALARLALARRRGDLDAALREVAPFLEPVEAATSHELAQRQDARALALMNLAIVELWASHLVDAERHLEDALALAREIERPFVEITCLGHLSLLASTRSFGPARQIAREALLRAEANGWAASPVAGAALTSLASMDAAQARFEEARRGIDAATPLVGFETDPAGALLLQFVRGDLLAGQGRLAEAIEALRQAERLQGALQTRHLLTGPAHEAIALIQIRAGDLAAARATLGTEREADAAGADEATAIAVLKAGRLARAALRVAEGRPHDAIAELGDLLTESASVLRVGTRVQALLVGADAWAVTGDGRLAEDLIERALDLAEPDSLVLPFLTTPAPRLSELLERHPRHRTAHAAFLSDVIAALHGSAITARPSGTDSLVEPLSSTELRVLRYLPSNLSASEIAGELVVSTSTVKTHMRHIYDKLDAHRRTEAVDRARRLGLLGPSAPRGR